MRLLIIAMIIFVLSMTANMYAAMAGYDFEKVGLYTFLIPNCAAVILAGIGVLLIHNDTKKGR